MKIDGRTIASGILNNLKERVKKLKDKGITPKLAIILVGNDPASVSYVEQKEIKGNRIGVSVEVINLSTDISTKDLLKVINNLNQNNEIHGIIVQRPLPTQINADVISQSIKPNKDVDSFNTQSKFSSPITAAIFSILEHIYSSSNLSDQNMIDWLRSNNVVIVGKGETGGGPVSKELTRLRIGYKLIDSKTKKPLEIMREADILISAVGKPDIVTSDSVKKGTILISIGIYRGKDKKLHGDYNEEDIKDIASFYTPTPGGVGAINLAMLFKNLLHSAEKS